MEKDYKFYEERFIEHYKEDYETIRKKSIENFEEIPLSNYMALFAAIVNNELTVKKAMKVMRAK